MKGGDCASSRLSKNFHFFIFVQECQQMAGTLAKLRHKTLQSATDGTKGWRERRRMKSIELRYSSIKDLVVWVAIL